MSLASLSFFSVAAAPGPAAGDDVRGCDAALSSGVAAAAVATATVPASPTLLRWSDLRAGMVSSCSSAATAKAVRRGWVLISAVLSAQRLPAQMLSPSPLLGLRRTGNSRAFLRLNVARGSCCSAGSRPVL